MYIDFLNVVMEKLPQTSKLCLILGATKFFDDKTKIELHKNLNDAIVAYADKNERVKYVKIDDCVESKSDFTNQINHFKKIVYYKLSQHIIKVIGENDDSSIQPVSKVFVVLDSFAWWFSRRMKEGSALKSCLRKFYRKLKGK